MRSPNPVISVASSQRPRRSGKWRPRYEDFEEDPTFRVHSDRRDDQTIIQRQGELHLEINRRADDGRVKVDANVGAPQGGLYARPVRKNASSTSRASYRTDRRPRPVRPRRHHTCGARQPGSGFVSKNKRCVAARFQEYISPVEAGGERTTLENACWPAFYPMVDVKVELVRRILPRRGLEPKWSSKSPGRCRVNEKRPGAQGRNEFMLEPIMDVDGA